MKEYEWRKITDKDRPTEDELCLIGWWKGDEWKWIFDNFAAVWHRRATHWLPGRIIPSPPDWKNHVPSKEK